MRDATGAYRHVVVVGGTSEIAKAVLVRLIARGTRSVTLLVRDTAAGHSVLTALGADGHVVAFDTSNSRQHAEVARQAATGRPDIDLVLVASGVLGDAERAVHDPAYAAEIMTTTFTGTATMTGALADVLVAQGHGTIAVLSSVAGVRVRGDNHVYGAAKAGLDGFAQGLAQRLHATGVDVCILRPGYVRTRMSAGIPEAPFAVSADAVAADLLSALARGHHAAWSPRVLRVVMTVLRLLPASVFRRISEDSRRSR